MIPIAIDDQAWEQTPLAVHDAIALHARPQTLTPLPGLFDAAQKEGAIDALTAFGEQSRGDERTRIDIATTNEAPALGVDVDERTGFIGLQVGGDLIAEHPRMAQQESLFMSLMQAESCDRLAHDLVNASLFSWMGTAVSQRPGVFSAARSGGGGPLPRPPCRAAWRCQSGRF